MTEEQTTVDRNTCWERYWHDLPAEAGHAIWDSEASINAAVHHELFKPHLTPGLPLLDLGCGNGTQTAYLGAHYTPVIGLDISPSAIASATRTHTHPDVSFREFDMVDLEAARALHDEFGDCNVYVRAVLHVLPDDARGAAAATIARLMGRSGGLFVTELAPAAFNVFMSALDVGPDTVPKVRRVLDYGIVGATLKDGQLETVLSGQGIDIVKRGSSVMRSTETGPDGECLMIPFDYVIGRAPNGG